MLAQRPGRWPGSGGQGCPVGNGEGMGSLLVLAKAKCKAVRTWSKHHTSVKAGGEMAAG